METQVDIVVYVPIEGCGVVPLLSRHPVVVPHVCEIEYADELDDEEQTRTDAGGDGIGLEEGCVQRGEVSTWVGVRFFIEYIHLHLFELICICL